ncbi:MAG TPA: class I SAM-dependent methyltransferase [Jatrophihabitantaceae bacterium]|jgi:SAM-dependent methyltransferase
MSYVIDWAEQAEHLHDQADIDAAWNTAVAAQIVRASDRFAVDAGCGAGGMTRALAAALPADARVVGIDGSAEVLAVAAQQTSDERISFVLAAYEDGFAASVSQPADLVWASASVHHASDQQAAVDRLAELLASGGRLALAEGGLPAHYLPWDVGVGAPGLEERLVAAGQRWFERMRAELPGATRMPYGWPSTLKRAGLSGIRTRTVLVEQPAPLADSSIAVHALRSQVDRLADTDLLDADDRAAWARLLDPSGAEWLGARDDLYVLRARSIHTGEL